MKKINEKILYEGQWLSVRQTIYQNKEGKELTWECVDRKRSTVGVVIVAQLMPSKRFILIKQYRPAIDGYIIALPAGLGFNDPNHALVELKEETGYIGKIRDVSPVLKTGASLINDNARIVHIEVDENLPANQSPVQELEDAEDIEVCLVYKEEAKDFLLREIEKGVHVASNLWYLFGLIFSACLGTHAFADGSIKGMIRFDGTAPDPRLIHMDADPVCYAVNKGNIHSSSIILGKDNALANAFVYIKSGLTQKNYPPPAVDAVVNQGGCNYSPHVIGVMVGQKVKFLNPDGTLHNVHAMCQINPEFNEAMPDFLKEIDKTFNKPEFMFPIRCDVHPWMQAWMAVMAHPFFAVTGPDGKFEIKNVPAGTYTIEVWHEKLGTKTAVVTVTDGASQTTDFTFSTPN